MNMSKVQLIKSKLLKQQEQITVSGFSRMYIVRKPKVADIGPQWNSITVKL